MTESILGYLEMVGGSDDDSDDSMTSVTLSGYPRRLAVCKHKMLKLGRNEKECDLVFQDPAISSVHCLFWAILFDEESSPMCYVKDCSLNGTYMNGSLLKRNRAYLLQDGDLITLKDRVGRVFRFSGLGQAANSQLIAQMGFERKVNDWEVTSRIIGNGTFGHVLVAYRNSYECDGRTSSVPQSSPENYAVKIIKLKPNKLDKEAKILLKLNHVCSPTVGSRRLKELLTLSSWQPNIIKVHHTYCDLKDNLYIFQDLIPGGDLFSYLAKGDCLASISETESLIIVYQVLHALKYLHDKGIVHRDLKLDNILLCAPEPCTRIVLADFGIAKDLSTAKARMHTVVGTPEYCAPEVGFKASREAYQCFSRAATLEQKGYDRKCDLWSLGVIAHIMLTGISPFYGDGTERSIIQNAKVGKLNFTAKQWCAVAESAKNFVRKLLEVDANKRLDCDESLRHPWISKHVGQLDKIYSKKILNSTDSAKKLCELNENVPEDDFYVKCTSEWKRKLPKSVAMDHTGPRKKKHRPGV